jgi:hypothetical protein
MLQEVISRKEAKERGLKRYHGNCSKHGLVERYTCDFKCVACGSEQKLRYRQRYPEKVRERKRAHRLAHPEYNIWRLMKRRCYKSTDPVFPHYCGRGIFVCDRWLESWRNFLEDMGPRPSPKHSIDRIDNDGPYSPENCRWALPIQQHGNTRTNVFIEHNGKIQHLADWSRETGLKYNTIQNRLKQGWPMERLFEPARPYLQAA